MIVISIHTSTRYLLLRYAHSPHAVLYIYTLHHHRTTHTHYIQAHIMHNRSTTDQNQAGDTCSCVWLMILYVWYIRGHIRMSCTCSSYTLWNLVCLHILFSTSILRLSVMEFVGKFLQLHQQAEYYSDCV